MKNPIPTARTGWVALVLALTVLASACAGSAESTADADGEPTDTAGPTQRTVTVAGAPDETLDYLRDSGRLAEIEEEWGMTLELTTSWDEFAFFVGGHGDIVSTAIFELPLLEAETGEQTVTFGRYSRAKIPILVRGDSPYQTMEDLVGETIVAGNPIGTTLIWGAFVKAAHDLDFRFEGVGGEPAGDDFETILGDHATNPSLVVRGDAEACVCVPFLAAEYMRTGELRGLYDGASASQYYERVVQPGHSGLMENVFTAKEEWYEDHPYEVAFFLALYEEGIRLRQENREEVVRTYPQHFAAENDEDIEFLIEYLEENDPVEGPYIEDEEWIENETAVFDLMVETGFADDIEVPRLEVFTAERVRELAPDTWNAPPL